MGARGGIAIGLAGLSLAVGALASGAPAQSSGGKGAGHPNVVVIQADDQTVESTYAELSLKVANGKPVYPYVWELYHNAALSIDQTLIPPQEIYWHVQGALKANVNGAKVAGLIWWGISSGPNGTEPSLKAFRQALDGVPFQP